MRHVLQILAILTCLAAAAAGQDDAGCPTIKVTGPAGITRPGESFTFTGTVDGKLPENVRYEWSATGGKIVEGQGTLKISADADWREWGATVTVILTVHGLPDGCPSSASETSGVTWHHGPILIDEFGRLADDAVRKRIYKFIAELEKNPNNQGFIILYGTEKEMNSRERFILDSINFRSFDRPRITIVRAGRHESGRVYTKLYRIPPGAENPTP